MNRKDILKNYVRNSLLFDIFSNFPLAIIHFTFLKKIAALHDTINYLKITKLLRFVKLGNLNNKVNYLSFFINVVVIRYDIF